MLEQNKYNFPQEEFDLIYDLTKRKERAESHNFNNNNEDKVSYKAFIDVMRNLKRDYMRYRTIFKN